MWCGYVQGNSNEPLVPMVRLVPVENGATGEYAVKGGVIYVIFNKRAGVFYQGIKPQSEAK